MKRRVEGEAGLIAGERKGKGEKGGEGGEGREEAGLNESERKGKERVDGEGRGGWGGERCISPIGPPFQVLSSSFGTVSLPLSSQ